MTITATTVPVFATQGGVGWGGMVGLLGTLPVRTAPTVYRPAPFRMPRYSTFLPQPSPLPPRLPPSPLTVTPVFPHRLSPRACCYLFLFVFLCFCVLFLSPVVLNEQWQMEGQVDLSLDVDMYIIDLFGKGAIKYLVAGTDSSSFFNQLVVLLLLLPLLPLSALPLSANGTRSSVEYRRNRTAHELTHLSPTAHPLQNILYF